MLTYSDLLDHALAYAGTDVSEQASARHRAAVQAAYVALPTRHPWGYLFGINRVATVAPQTDGTVEYDHTGGAYERVLTLSSATWPSWAADGYVVIDDVPYPVESRKSATELTLSENANPGADVAAGTEYSIRRDLYTLPAGFVAADEVVVNAIGSVLQYQHPREWASQRRLATGPGQPAAFSLIGSETSPGRTRMALYPAPDAVYAIDMLYKRKPRALVYSSVTGGTVSGASGGTAVTGTGTSFVAAHVGSVIRFGSDNTTVPTGPRGNSPAAFETTVAAYTSATAVTVADALPQTFTDVKYEISDPVDIDEAVMSEYLLREVEAQFRSLARSKPVGTEDQMLVLALRRAMESDNRFTGRRASGRFQNRRSGFDHYPLDFGV